MAHRRTRELHALTEAKRIATGQLLVRHRGQRTLVFTDGTSAAYRLATEFLISPITCDIGRKEREEVLAAFREGRIQAIVSAQVLNEGIDIPEAEVAVIVGGRGGLREHVQRVGRLLRPKPGKKATVYELLAAVPAEERRGSRRRVGLTRSLSRSGNCAA